MATHGGAAAVVSGARPRLRTKDGCLACRSQRKKCDRETPTCGPCVRASRACLKPSDDDLHDARFGKRIGFIKRSRSRRYCKPIQNESGVAASRSCGSPGSIKHFHPNEVTKTILESHFFSTLFPLITLASADSQHGRHLARAFEPFKPNHNELRLSVLACSAAHFHVANKQYSAPQAIELYHNAVLGIRQSVNRLSEDGRVVNDGIIMAILLLIVYGAFSPQQDSGLIHLKAVICMLKHRCQLSESLTQPMTILVMHALDTTLFHIFRLGVWHPQTPDFVFDPDFWLMAEKHLHHARNMGNYSSLVLGLPSSFYKAILCLVAYIRCPTSVDCKRLIELRTELNFWKIGLWDDVSGISSGCEEFYYSDRQDILLATYRLAVFVTTLIPINPYFRSQHEVLPTLHELRSDEVVEKAVNLLRRVRLDSRWSSCHICAWPVFLLGFCVSCVEDMDIIRFDLGKRFSKTSMWEYRSMLDTLEIFWKSLEK